MNTGSYSVMIYDNGTARYILMKTKFKVTN